jgi:hypothetical protein
MKKALGGDKRIRPGFMGLDYVSLAEHLKSYSSQLKVPLELPCFDLGIIPSTCSPVP